MKRDIPGRVCLTQPAFFMKEDILSRQFILSFVVILAFACRFADLLGASTQALAIMLRLGVRRLALEKKRDSHRSCDM